MIKVVGLIWSVCEFILVFDVIKWEGVVVCVEVDVWKDMLVCLGKVGVLMVCYNFMLIVDWM